MGQELTVEAPSEASPVADVKAEGALMAEWREEIARYHEEMKGLADQDHDEALRWLAATSARVAEMRSRSWDMKSGHAAGFRSRKVEPFLSDCDRQYTIASRRIALIEQELRMTTGRGA